MGLFLLCGSAALLAAGAGARAGEELASGELARFEHRRIVMGTLGRIVVFAPSEEAARDGAAAAFERMLELDGVLSDYREESELMRLSAAAGTGPVEVGADLFAALAQARAVAEASDGAFDPTIGPLSHLWRACRGAGRLPSGAELQAARARVGWERLVLDPETRSAALLEPGMQLDLGGIGKGLACREALEVLRQRGLARALVALGGDLVAGEPPPGRAAWSIALDCGGAREATSAEEAGGAAARRVELVEAAVSTSGDAEQHLDAGGERFSHVLDPRTGLGLTNRLCASVVAPDGALADALASAVCVLGAEAGRGLVARFPGARLFLEDGRFTPLFDGRTLQGWTTVGGRYDGRAVWAVEDGCITGRTGERGAGGLLYTERRYTSFEVELAVKLEHPFDSGVFLRMAPELRGAQVTLDDRPDGEIAGIYSDGWLENNPTGVQLWKRGEWNDVKVRCTGFDMRIEVWLNGTAAADYRLPDDTPGFAPTGLIGIQVHGTQESKTNAARFRDLRVRELPLFGEFLEPVPDAPGQLQPTAEATAAGWAALGASASLEGWELVGREGGVRVEDGALCLSSGAQEHLLRTAADYGDFRLRLEFQAAAGVRGSVVLRGAREGAPAAGYEVQLDGSPAGRLTGSLRGSEAAAPGAELRPAEAWNTLELLCRGHRLAVALNGHTLYDLDLQQAPMTPPFAERAKRGFLGLRSEPSAGGDAAAGLRFRSLFVQRLGE